MILILKLIHQSKWLQMYVIFHTVNRSNHCTYMLLFFHQDFLMFNKSLIYIKLESNAGDGVRNNNGNRDFLLLEVCYSLAVTVGFYKV